VNPRDTIAALSTPPGRGGLGVIRISGPGIQPIVSPLLRPQPAWQPWRASLHHVLDAAGAPLDQAIVTYFAAPKSYTGEHQVEIACHGSPVILRAVLARVLDAGARLAEPGEFTLRAVLNGRLDLPRAEAIRDLIDSTTLYQARVALQQAEGSVSRRLQPLKDTLVELITLLEAGIDFAEDDVDVAAHADIARRSAALLTQLEQLAATYAYGKLVHEGFTLAIVGRPNAGKSSLFNRLLDQDRAIVTGIPGTTRDVVTETASLDGLPVRLMDTAGLREGQDEVERLGIERSFQAMADADVTLIVVDLARDLDAEIWRPRIGGQVLIAGNKADLGVPASFAGLAVSALTGQGIPELRAAIKAAVAPSGAEPEPGFLTSLRQERLLRESIEALHRAHAGAQECVPHEMLLVDLYAALTPLDAITGATTADDILHRIFSTFCIGK